MSAILGVFGSETPLRDGEVDRMLGAMQSRGIERTEIWRDGDTVLAVGRFEWEMAHDFSGETMIAVDDRYVVVADASLYYRRELLAALEAAGVRPRGDSVAELLLAAYHAWGDDAPLHLDSDCAFIVWDRQARRAVAFRDYGSKRPLHYAALGREFVLASSIAGVVAHPRCPTTLDLDVVAGTTAGLVFSAGPQTVYEAVHALPSAHRIAWKAGRLSEPLRYWEVPFGEPDTRLSDAEAAEHLRELLSTASRERMVRGEVNTVWMSGGWDSSSVFGAASNAARAADFASAPRPVSISYPEGDPGREDEWIEAIAAQWGVPIHWIDIADIPFFDREDERAAARDEPYAHLYERWNVELARGTRACGARVALDGNGGDQLFQNSDVFLADLFRSGRWLRLAREWPERERGGFRDFVSTVIKPNLSPTVIDLVGRARGRPVRHHLERRVPDWLNADFVASRQLIARDLENVGRSIDATHAQREIDWMFTTSFISRAFASITSWALAEGVELRSPLSDRRVIEFALTRPWWERSSGKETKILLRQAMKGLLPDEVLAPRAHRTGITAGYSHRSMAELYPPLLDRVLEKPMILEAMGIVDSKTMRSAAQAYPRTGDAWNRVNLYYTLQTELWLRAREATASAGVEELELGLVGTV